MKRYYSSFLVSLIFLIFTIPTYAQVYIGGGLSFGAGISKLGINARGTFDIADKLVAQPGVNFFFKDKSVNGIDISYFSIDLDAIYKLIKIGETVEIFPVAGINIFNVGIKGDNTALNLRKKGTQVGLNLGLGTKIETLTSLNYFGEFKFTIGGIDQTTVTVGVLYGF